MSSTDGLIANNARYVAGFTKGSLPCPGQEAGRPGLHGRPPGPCQGPGPRRGRCPRDPQRRGSGDRGRPAQPGDIPAPARDRGDRPGPPHRLRDGDLSHDAVKDQIEADTGLRPSFALEAFPRADDDVKQTAAWIKANPFIPHKNIRGFVYEVESGRLREIPLD